MGNPLIEAWPARSGAPFVWREEAAYALVVAATAGATPFAALILNAGGLPLDQVSVAMAAPLLLRVIAARALASWAGRFRCPWRPLIYLTLCAAGATAGPSLATHMLNSHEHAWIIVMSWWALCLSSGASAPFVDVAILQQGGGRRRLARRRVIAAFAYIAATSAAGVIFTRFGGMALMSAISVACIAATIALIGLLDRPSWGEPGAALAPTVSTRPQLDLRLYAAFFAAALIVGSHGLHAMALISWRQRGISPALSGLIWGAGPVADLLFLSWLGTSKKPMGTLRLLRIGGIAATVRWLAYAQAPAIPLLLLLQAAHALSFTATGLALVEMVGELSERGRYAQNVLATWSLVSGLALGAGTLLASPLYARLGLGAYLIMAGVSFIGLLISCSTKSPSSALKADQYADLGPATPHFR